jgi:tRNA 2-thiouridine synthesizing protein A
MTNGEHDNLAADAEWDAGDMGCGELVLELRLRLQAMAPGSILKLTTRDLGAPEDLPAWCGMTGHTLLKAQHPEYWIRRRER